MAKLITTYWRDIPAQVIAKQGRRTAKVMLSTRFQEAIDRAAMRAGKGSSDAYMEDWRREYSDCIEDLDAVANEAAERLEAAFSDEQLERMVKAKGLADPDAAAGRASTR
ncbi:MAG: virulence factor [Pseudomonadota bacterium]